LVLMLGLEPRLHLRPWFVETDPVTDLFE